MKYITGDLLDMAEKGDFDVIIHGCNCHCAMGRGIALQIKNRYPEVYDVDLKTPKSDPSKLGKISLARVEAGSSFIVVNAYTQFNYTGAKVLVDYDAVRACMRLIKLSFTGLRIGYPKIGAGLAGGDWEVISQSINEELEGEDHTLVLWDKG
jgi:O-acetyl-ADP-ribose deacetylase (regulator of RNase III)